MRLSRRFVIPSLLAAAGGALAGCNWFYYGAMERIGREKRDILARRVAAGREDQEKAKEQFQTTLEAFQELTGFEGGELEKVYKRLNNEFERCENRAEKVKERIRGIDKVANDLFREWDTEIQGIENRTLRAKSEELLDDTRRRYVTLIEKMRQAEGKMEPVLQAFSDQVIFLKHNLNARAIRSLGDIVLAIDSEVAALVADIEASIAEADEFVETLSGDG